MQDQAQSTLQSRHPRGAASSSLSWFTVLIAQLIVIGLAWLPARVAIAQQALPVQTFTNFMAGSSQTFTIDLGTLPSRPWLIVEVTPDLAHSNMQLQIEATNWQFLSGHPGACFTPSNSFLSPPVPGAASLSVSLNSCDPRTGGLVGERADIIVRAIDLGSASSAAAVGITIRGETRPPTGTLVQAVDTSLAPRTANLSPSKDTVVYADDPAASNGRGPFLWAGSVGASNSFPRHTLMAFDFNGHVPPTANVDRANLLLGVTGFGAFGSGGPLTIERLATGIGGVTWDEGNASSLGDGFFGAASSISAADWIHPRSGFQWVTPGGNPFGAVLVNANVNQTGAWNFSSSALTAAVQDMVSNNDNQHGVLMSTPGEPQFGLYGIQIASRENTTPNVQTPTLVVNYTPTQSDASGNIVTNTVNFINEGQNFRWIYDLDHDDIFVTDKGGVCEVLSQTNQHVLPYSYRFTGVPFTGIDCCTWRIESPLTSTVGTGQALFFHNLDANNPANLPPDFDQDGIRNLCDNCAYTPNGPLRGSCVAGPNKDAACHSNLECGAGQICDLSQEDTDGNFVGNACPEPGSAVSVFAGVGLLAALRARRGKMEPTNRFERSTCSLRVSCSTN